MEDRAWERLFDNSDYPLVLFTAFVDAPEPGGLATSHQELVKLLALHHSHRRAEVWREQAPWLREQVAQLLAEEVRPGPRRGGAGRGRPDSSGGTVYNEQRGTANDFTAV